LLGAASGALFGTLRVFGSAGWFGPSPIRLGRRVTRSATPPHDVIITDARAGIRIRPIKFGIPGLEDPKCKSPAEQGLACALKLSTHLFDCTRPSARPRGLQICALPSHKMNIGIAENETVLELGQFDGRGSSGPVRIETQHVRRGVVNELRRRRRRGTSRIRSEM